MRYLAQKMRGLVPVLMLLWLCGCGVIDQLSNGETVEQVSPEPNLIPLAIVNPSLADAVVGKPYEQTLAAIGGSPRAYTWSIEASGAGAPGALPPGIELLSSKGAFVTLKGIPTTVESYTFSVRLSDARSEVSKSFRIVVAEDPSIPKPLIVVGNLEPEVTAGSSLTLELSASGGEAPYAWALIPRGTTSQIPTWLRLSPTNGKIQAEPPLTQAAHTFEFWVEVTDSRLSEVQSLKLAASLQVSAAVIPELKIDFVPPSRIREGMTYTRFVTVDGGIAPFIWSAQQVSGDPLPAWILLDEATGALEIKPPTGVAPLTLEMVVGVHDSASQQAEKPWTLAISPLVADTEGVRIVPCIGCRDVKPGPWMELPLSSVATAYSYTFAAIGGVAPYTWRAFGLPTWLSLDAQTGVLSSASIPDIGVQPRFTVTVQDASTPIAFSHSMSVVMYATAKSDAPLLFPLGGVVSRPGGDDDVKLPGATVNEAYACHIPATGGTPPYHYALHNAPPWLSIDDSGWLRGTPTDTVMGQHFEVECTDSAGVPKSDRSDVQISVFTASLPIFTVASPLSVYRGLPYKGVLSVDYGAVNGRWQVAQGNLPAGLTIDEYTGHVTGKTQAAPGDYMATIEMTSRSGLVASVPFIFHVADPEAGKVYTIAGDNGGRFSPPGSSGSYSDRFAFAPYLGAYGGDGGLGLEGQIGEPMTGAFDARGNLIFVDTRHNHAIRKLDFTTNRMTTMVGGLSRSGGGNVTGPASQVTLNVPTCVDIDDAGNIYIMQGILSQTVLRLNPTTQQVTHVADYATVNVGVRMIVARDGSAVYVGMVNDRRVARFDTASKLQTAITASGMAGVWAMELSHDNSLLFMDENFVLWRYEPVSKALNELADFGAHGDPLYPPLGLREHPLSHELYYVTVDGGGARFYRIGFDPLQGAITSSSPVTLYAGGGTNLRGSGIDAQEARFLSCWDLTFDAEGNLYVFTLYGDETGEREDGGAIRKIIHE